MTTSHFEENVKKRAFELFLERGASHGFDQDDWFKAENEQSAKIAKEKIESQSGARAVRKGKL